ncbi:putative germin-like protein 2-1 [Tanacetum coccineum]
MLATCSLTLASDPTPLQDFCVADLNSKVLVNGVICKDPNDVKAEDFLFRGLQRMGNTSNPVGSDVTTVTVNQLAGLNTFGISMARIDFAPWGLNAPHTHPRATEILTVIEGLSSQNPGVITIANAVFGSNPDISRDILAKAFQTNVNVIKQIQSKF